MKKNVVHITSEVAPFYKRGGLGDVLGALPRYLTNEQYDNVVISQYYKGKTTLPDHYIKSTGKVEIFEIEYEYYYYFIEIDGVKYYFLNLSDEDEFSLLESVNDGDQPYKGNSSFMYYLYYAKCALNLINAGNLSPDFLFCHDWQTTGIHVFQDELQRLKTNHHVKTVLVIHNYDYQGDIYESSLKYLPKEISNEIIGIINKYNSATMLAIGIEKSDFISTVSPTYAKELAQQGLPHKGLKYLREKNQIIPFLNGADYSIWHPKNSPYLNDNYCKNSIYRKNELKSVIFKECGLVTTEGDDDAPLVLMMSRLTAQKGVQLFISDEPETINAMKTCLDSGVRVIIYGTPSGGIKGDIHKNLSALESRFKGLMFYDANYNEKNAHRYLAAADILLAPSLFEPCGLVQIYAQAFGTVPVVRPVGGLKDTVISHQDSPLDSTGFYIEDFCSLSMWEAINEAVKVYKTEPEVWKNILIRGMRKDFSWKRLSHQYFDFFDEVQ